MSLACRTHGHAGCVGAEQDDCEIVTQVTATDLRELSVGIDAVIARVSEMRATTVRQLERIGHLIRDRRPGL